MAAKTVVITDELFSKIKKKYRHHWAYLGVWEWRGPTKNKKIVYCRCDLCSTPHWVMWRNLYEGKSTRCKQCSKKPVGIEIEFLNEELEKQGSLYRITGDSKSNGTGTRLYQLICEGCNKEKWLCMASLKKAKACRSCANSWWQKEVVPTPKRKEMPKDEAVVLPVGKSSAV